MSLHALVDKWLTDAVKIEGISRKTDAKRSWDNGACDALRSCANELQAALAGGGEAVGWQCRFDDGNNGWTEWEEVKERSPGYTVANRVAEIRDYIASGYKYELRPLFTHPADAVQVTDEAVELATYAIAHADSNAYSFEHYETLARAGLRALNPGGSRE